MNMVVLLGLVLFIAAVFSFSLYQSGRTRLPAAGIDARITSVSHGLNGRLHSAVKQWTASRDTAVSHVAFHIFLLAAGAAAYSVLSWFSRWYVGPPARKHHGDDLRRLRVYLFTLVAALKARVVTGRYKKIPSSVRSLPTGEVRWD